MSGRVLGIDPGSRRVGVALSDEIGLVATPFEVIDTATTHPVKRIGDLADQFEVETIVVGLPRSLSGEEGPAAAAARELGDGIASATGRNLVYWDERFTTIEAEKALLEAGMTRKQRRDTTDKVAAAVMLQGYLDAQGRNDT